MTSELLRAQETADIAFEGRMVSRLVLPVLNDPLAGIFEGGPVEDYHAWLSTHGPDEQVPGTGVTLRQAAYRFLAAARFLSSRAERMVLVVAHAPVIRWILQAIGDRPHAMLDYLDPKVEYAQPIRVLSDELARSLSKWERDPHATFV